MLPEWKFALFLLLHAPILTLWSKFLRWFWGKFSFLCLLSFQEAGRHYAIVYVMWVKRNCINKRSYINIRNQSKARKRNSRFSTSNQNRSNKETTIYDLTDSLRTANFLFMAYGTRDFQHLIRTAATKRWRLTICTHVQLANCEFPLHGIRNSRFSTSSIRIAVTKRWRLTTYQTHC